jgi:two-component system, LuxR family, sensor kinase FixL
VLKSDFLEASLLLKAVFETASDGIISINKDGVIQLANPAIGELFQYEVDELLGENISILMPEPHQTAHDGYIENYFKTGQKKIIGIGRQVKGRRKDGTLFPIRLCVNETEVNGYHIFTGIIHDLSEQWKAEKSIKRLNVELGERVQLRTNELLETVDKMVKTNAILGKEIAERKKVEQLLRESEKEIRIALEKERELNELKSRFVTMASHEFRTPLSTILSSTSLLEMYNKEEQNEQRKKHLQRIRSSIGTLTNILNDFLSLSKLEEGIIKCNPEEFNFSEFCLEIIDEMEGLLKPGQHINHENLSPQQNDVVFLDRSLLRNILYNLLSNAIKYSSAKKSIYCKNEFINSDLIITIKDEGMGIPKPEQVHLFTRFFRASNATNIQGTGLGLHIVKQYLDLMNATIDFTSEAEVGTTVVITIPQSKK